MQDEIIDKLTEALADQYEVQDHLGSGGMAYVYLANDIKHERTVAIKVLQPELAASLGGERFLQEIKIAAKLTHPHILPLYDSGNANGLLYYVMPLVEGETLADLLEREKQLGYKDALQYVKEVADALAYAHARGVVHRDIKPDNIYVTGGHAVVADFGIARALTSAGGDRLTQTGMAVGTPAYMSPEQAMGLTDVDGRSDIYSLGCVLYELIVGQIPFTGPTAQAVMARHSMDMVPRLHIMRDTVPDELEDAVITAMAKSPADRYRTANDFAQALDDVDLKNATRAYKAHTAAHQTIHQTRPTQQAITPSTPMPIPSLKNQRGKRIAVGAAAVVVIGALGAYFGGRGTVPNDGLTLRPSNIAVLYFDDVSPRGELGFAADGITEGLIEELSRVRSLNVISRNGVATYRGTELSRDSIGRALDVGTLIEGRVDQVGGRLTVTALLIDGNSGADYERATVEAPEGEFLAARDSLVQEVSLILRGQLGQEVRLQAARAGASTAAAWALFQQSERSVKEAKEAIAHGDGLPAWNALDRADSSLALAEAQDGNWLAPTVQRAIVAGERLPLLDTPQEMADWIVRGIAHADRALARDKTSAEALAARGRLRYGLWRTRTVTDPAESDRLISNAKADLQAAVGRDNTLADAHRVLSEVLYVTDGSFEAGLAARDAYEADAYLAYADIILDRLFWTSFDVEQFGQAVQWCDEGHDRFSNDERFTQCQLWLMTTSAKEADVDRAWQLLEESVSQVSPNDRQRRRQFSQMVVGGVLARAGLSDSADAVLEGARAGTDIDPTNQLAFDEAFMRILNGQQDEAIDLLKRYLFANEHQDHGLERDGELHWFWRPLQNHDRFGELTR